MPGLVLAIGVLLGAAPVVLLLHRCRGDLAVSRRTAAGAVSAAEEAQARLDASSAELGRAWDALDALRIGVVLADRNRTVQVRNHAAEHPGGSRHGDLLVEGVVAEHLDAAVRGESRRQLLDLHGPPRRVVVVQSRPLPQGGGVVTIDDVTERSRLDAVRTDFVANISHELKTPVGALAVLAEAIADADEHEVVRRLSSKMVDEAHRVARTIDDLLELSRIELGGDAVRDEVRAVTVVHEAADRVRPLAEARRITLLLKDPPEELAVVGDRRQLVSALGNLLENAVKYSEVGSEVDVSAFEDDGWIVFEVADHGIGIPDRDLDRVFERFYRVDKARSRETGGTGLGLAIVRHVATNHGGEVTVTSSEGVGSTFRLRIPAAGRHP